MSCYTAAGGRRKFTNIHLCSASFMQVRGQSLGTIVMRTEEILWNLCCFVSQRRRRKAMEYHSVRTQPVCCAPDWNLGPNIFVCGCLLAADLHNSTTSGSRDPPCFPHPPHTDGTKPHEDLISLHFLYVCASRKASLQVTFTLLRLLTQCKRRSNTLAVVQTTATIHHSLKHGITG